MFVQSAAFVERHRKNVTEISIYGQEKIAETIRLCKMNLAVHGLAGDIRDGQLLLRRPVHDSRGKFDFVMANPPFNVDKIDKERLKDDPPLSRSGCPRPTTPTISGFSSSTRR